MLLDITMAADAARPTEEEQLEAVKQKLPAHLHKYLSVCKWGDVWINHPFCVCESLTMLTDEDLKTCVVDSIADRQATFDKLCLDGEWVNAVFSVERAFRQEFLDRLVEQHWVEKLLPAIAPVWIDAEGMMGSDKRVRIWHDIWQSVLELEEFGSKHSRRDVMNEEDRAAYDALPSRFMIYRGFNGYGSKVGFSWTLSRETAEGFARRGLASSGVGNAQVASLTVDKKDALALFTGRNESEIVVLPWFLDWEAVNIENLQAAAA